jgi:hypothetical protein
MNALPGKALKATAFDFQSQPGGEFAITTFRKDDSPVQTIFTLQDLLQLQYEGKRSPLGVLFFSFGFWVVKSTRKNVVSWLTLFFYELQLGVKTHHLLDGCEVNVDNLVAFINRKFYT